MLNKFYGNFGIYKDICRNVIRPSKEECHCNSRANQKTIASNEKVRICQSLPFLCHSSSFNIFAYSIHIVSAIAVSE